MKFFIHTLHEEFFTGIVQVENEIQARKTWKMHLPTGP